MKESQVLSSYEFHSKVYWATFGVSLAPGRRLAARLLECKPGESLLEIGVGTGLSLSMFPKGVKIHGIDLSPMMLERARVRAVALGLDPENFEVMDAQKMSFPDDSFDKSSAMFVASVAPDPLAMVREMKRVTRPGGLICIANHFSHKGSWTSYFEKLISPLGPKMGFRPLFYLDEFLKDAKLEGAREVPVPPFGYWQVLMYRNTK